VVRAADADRQRIETQAAAERQRMSLEAEGRATALRAQAAAEGEAAKIRGAAEAEAARLRGLAEADVIRAKGEAEAEAMRVKAAAYHEYNQAAVLDKVISNLPEIVRAIAEPLAKVDKISIVSTGGPNGSNLGASRVTGDVVNMLAQVPAILEALTGTRMADLMAQVPGLNTVDAGVNGANAANGTRDTKASDADAPRETATPETEPVTAEQPEAGGAHATNNAAPRR
jgi:flotillin